jgi:hypothetical protein
MSPVAFTPTTVANPIGVQGNYPFNLDVGHEGMIAEMQDYVVRTYVNQTATPLPFGAMVMTDNDVASNDPFAIKLATGATLNVGILVDSGTFEGSERAGVTGSAYAGSPGQFPGPSIAADGRMGYPPNFGCNVLSRGVIWVWTTEAIALGDAVRFWDTDFNGTVPGARVGRFCRTLNATRTTQVNGGARWLSETSGPGLVKLEINMPAATFIAD